MTAEQERAAVVKWLSAEAMRLQSVALVPASYANARAMALALAADAIEAGEHLTTARQE